MIQCSLHGPWRFGFERREGMGREDEIRLIAYAIWEEESCPDGRDCEHWLMAETVWEQREKARAGEAGSTGSAPKRAARRPAKATATASGRKARKTQP